jgi:hypothetical protein
MEFFETSRLEVFFRLNSTSRLFTERAVWKVPDCPVIALNFRPVESVTLLFFVEPAEKKKNAYGERGTQAGNKVFNLARSLTSVA